jgi:hypothetical protein
LKWQAAKSKDDPNDWVFKGGFKRSVKRIEGSKISPDWNNFFYFPILPFLLEDDVQNRIAFLGLTPAFWRNCDPPLHDGRSRISQY